LYLGPHQLELSPFENTPDPRFFFLSEDHREALANLVYAVRSQKGMVLLTGEVGMGKTTTTYLLESRVGDAAKLVIVRRVPSTPRQLLWQVAGQLGYQPKGSENRAQLFDMVDEGLRRERERNRITMVIVDEAQALPLPVLDEIRLLSNMETETYKLCQILLIGQNELREMLQTPRLEPLRQRIILAHHIRPLQREDTGRYVAHRLKRASAVQPPRVRFTDGALDAVHEMSGGIIRQINVLADKCLLVAGVKQTSEISQEIVRDASEHMVFGPQALARVGGAAGRAKAA